MEGLEGELPAPPLSGNHPSQLAIVPACKGAEGVRLTQQSTATAELPRPTVGVGGAASLQASVV
jgi:hypothetical protein